MRQRKGGGGTGYRTTNYARAGQCAHIAIPLSRQAAALMRPGEHWEPRIPSDVIVSDLPLPIRPYVPSTNGRGDLTGRSFGRLEVLGVYADNPSLRWVLRCRCGSYSLRETSGLLDAGGDREPMCPRCDKLESLKSGHSPYVSAGAQTKSIREAAFALYFALTELLESGPTEENLNAAFDAIQEARSGANEDESVVLSLGRARRALASLPKREATDVSVIFCDTCGSPVVNTPEGLSQHRQRLHSMPLPTAENVVAITTQGPGRKPKKREEEEDHHLCASCASGNHLACDGGSCRCVCSLELDEPRKQNGRIK